MTEIKKCIQCQHEVNRDDVYCPHCGQKVSDKNVFLSPWKTLTIFSISFFIPPAGYFYGYKYLKQEDPHLQMVGKIAIILTTIAIIISAVTIFFTIKIAREIIDTTNQSVLDINTIF